ncbi:PREDICTED: uncharacterized protein LOC105144995 [Acromyrmex echinatior]|uniref:uncharacterized protein LOC105144995 n=1 Tax=Acromyrmex echinatior TaxID=103372 RepID=UPI000580EF97|nr:PREDICTED: uncharacterized protein LOC105144995 [Acromyrmex echinatior]
MPEKNMEDQEMPSRHFSRDARKAKGAITWSAIRGTVTNDCVIHPKDKITRCGKENASLKQSISAILHFSITQVLYYVHMMHQRCIQHKCCLRLRSALSTFVITRHSASTRSKGRWRHGP